MPSTVCVEWAMWEDIVLFLSGIGLWFSWMKNPTYKAILHPSLPPHLSRLAHHRLPLLTSPCFRGGDTWAWVNLFGEISINWGFWLHDELNFWYIPATMMLYLFAPGYMELIKRHPIYRWLPVVMVMRILVEYVTPIHQAVGHLEIF